MHAPCARVPACSLAVGRCACSVLLAARASLAPPRQLAAYMERARAGTSRMRTRREAGGARNEARSATPSTYPTQHHGKLAQGAVRGASLAAHPPSPLLTRAPSRAHPSRPCPPRRHLHHQTLLPPLGKWGPTRGARRGARPAAHHPQDPARHAPAPLPPPAPAARLECLWLGAAGAPLPAPGASFLRSPPPSHVHAAGYSPPNQLPRCPSRCVKMARWESACRRPRGRPRQASRGGRQPAPQQQACCRRRLCLSAQLLLQWASAAGRGVLAVLLLAKRAGDEMEVSVLRRVSSLDAGRAKVRLKVALAGSFGCVCTCACVRASGWLGAWLQAWPRPVVVWHCYMPAQRSAPRQRISNSNRQRNLVMRTTRLKDAAGA